MRGGDVAREQRFTRVQVAVDSAPTTPGASGEAPNASRAAAIARDATAPSLGDRSSSDQVDGTLAVLEAGIDRRTRGVRTGPGSRAWRRR